MEISECTLFLILWLCGILIIKRMFVRKMIVGNSAPDFIRTISSSSQNRDIHRDKTGTEPHDSGTLRPLHFSIENTTYTCMVLVVLSAVHEGQGVV
jgi:hypothetical protein